MTTEELAKKMMQWKGDLDKLKVLESEIETAVLELKKTQTVGVVRATYSGGRATYESWEDAGVVASAELKQKFTTQNEVVDIDAVVKECPEDIVKKHTSVVERIDWKAVCEEAKIARNTISKTEPKVILKVLDK